MADIGVFIVVIVDVVVVFLFAVVEHVEIDRFVVVVVVVNTVVAVEKVVV